MIHLWLQFFNDLHFIYKDLFTDIIRLQEFIREFNELMIILDWF